MDFCFIWKVVFWKVSKHFTLKNRKPLLRVIFTVHLLTSSVGLLCLSAPLDYETQRFHRLTVRAVDHGQPSLSSTQTLTVEVGDVNDQSPEFSQSIYNASVAENRDPGEPVVRVSATDKDSGNNQQLYSVIIQQLKYWRKCTYQLQEMMIFYVQPKPKD